MYHPQVGDPLEALDTPVMLVDLDLMENNIASLMARFRGSGVRVRPHLKTIKSPELAQVLLAAGASGGCVAKVSEAEVMAQGGIEDLLITTEIVGKPKLARLVALVQGHPRIKVVVDSLTGAQALGQAMSEAHLHIDVLIDLDVGQNRCGVTPGEEALGLARFIGGLSNIRRASAAHSRPAGARATLPPGHAVAYWHGRAIAGGRLPHPSRDHRWHRNRRDLRQLRGRDRSAAGLFRFHGYRLPQRPRPDLLQCPDHPLHRD